MTRDKLVEIIDKVKIEGMLHILPEDRDRLADAILKHYISRGEYEQMKSAKERYQKRLGEECAKTQGIGYIKKSEVARVCDELISNCSQAHDALTRKEYGYMNALDEVKRRLR